MEVKQCDMSQCTKRSIIEYGKLPAKLSEETPWNKLCLDLIGPYKIHRKRKQPLLLKSITMIGPVTAWFEITQHSDKIAMAITNLVETTWLVRYPWLVDITYD